jgi:hypothetical protein
MTWKKVIYLADCTFADWDDDREVAICPVCKIDYADCDCPGPHQDDEFEYKEIKGVMFARPKQ